MKMVSKPIASLGSIKQESSSIRNLKDVVNNKNKKMRDDDKDEDRAILLDDYQEGEKDETIAIGSRLVKRAIYDDAVESSTRRN